MSLFMIGYRARAVGSRGLASTRRGTCLMSKHERVVWRKTSSSSPQLLTSQQQNSSISRRPGEANGRSFFQAARMRALVFDYLYFSCPSLPFFSVMCYFSVCFVVSDA